jgi:hypothetical protein
MLYLLLFSISEPEPKQHVNGTERDIRDCESDGVVDGRECGSNQRDQDETISRV